MEDPTKITGWEDSDPHYGHRISPRDENSSKECQRTITSRSSLYFVKFWECAL